MQPLTRFPRAGQQTIGSNWPLHRLFALIAVAFLASATPSLHAVEPPPDGAYPNANTAEGDSALFSLTTGAGNTAIGSRTLETVKTGNGNTGVGGGALTFTTGNNNTALGTSALTLNTTGVRNTASGNVALVHNRGGNSNTADGMSALFSNIGGDLNTAIGFEALYTNTSGNNNIALGNNAGSNLTTGHNNIDIGAPGLADEANTIRIGERGVQEKAFMQGIYGSPVSGGQQVFVNSVGKLGVVSPSSARFKENIKPMAESSAALLALQPVTFEYKPEMDGDGTPQFGLVAEEVAKVNPALVVRNAEGRIDGVRYEAVNAMLLNEFLKEHKKTDQQQTKIAELEVEVSKQKDLNEKVMQQQKQIDDLTTGLQQLKTPTQPRSERKGR